MFRGLLTSFVGHALLLAYALLSINRVPPQLPETIAIEASIITPSELTRLKQGSPDAKELEAKAKVEETPEVSKKEAEKPKPITAPPPPPPPPPPEPEKDEIAEAIEKERVAAEQREKEAAEKAAEAEKEAAALRAKIEAEQKAAEEAEAKKKAEAKRKAEEKKKAEAKKKKEAERKKKLADAKRKAEEEKKKKQFDADRIAALIDKSPDKRGAPRTAPEPTKPTDHTGPTLGERRGTDSVLSAREQDLLRSQLSGQLKRCWHLPGGGGGIETMVVTLKWRLKPDGSLDGVPQVVEPQSGPVFQIAAEAAVRAVTRCAPFSLPPDKYGVWKTVEWNFDPREMM